MAKHANATLRNNWAQDLLDELGPGHLVKYFDGTQPASTSASITGTLLTTFTSDSTPGSATGGVTTFDTDNYTQNNATNVNGTPTWASFQKADGTRVYELGMADGWTFNGVVQNGVDCDPQVWTWTAPDA